MANAERQYEHQTSRYKPRVSFKKSTRLVFRRRLGKENRAMIWVHKERHDEISRIADATGLTISQVTDTLVRYALEQMVVIDDEGKDHELREYLDDQLAIRAVPNEVIAAEQAAEPK